MIDSSRLDLPSASSFYADVECPGRQNLIRAVGAQATEQVASETSEFAKRGTRVHKARESESTFDLSIDELAAYTAGMKLERRLVLDWQEEFGIESIIEGPRESRLWLHHHVNLSPMLSGQLDVHYLSGCGKRACIVDWKTGSAESCGPANVSWQLRIQALLAWKEYESLEHIRAAFIKPEAFGEKLDYCDFTVFALQNIERYVHMILWQVSQPDAPFHAGEHCRWCPVKGFCKHAMLASESTLTVINPPADIADMKPKQAKEVITAAVQTAPVELVREMFGKRALVGYVLEAVKERLAALPPEEKYRLGLKMQMGRSTDKVKDVRGAFAALLAGGFPEEMIWGCLKMSKTDVVEMVESFKNVRESEAQTIYEVGLDEFIERGRGDEILSEA